MEKYKEITQKTKKSDRRLALFFLPFGLFFWFLSALSLVWDDIAFPWLIFILGLICIGCSASLWLRGKELTDYGLQQRKAVEERFFDAWYFRYPFAVFCSGLAYLSLLEYLSDHQPVPGLLVLFINPVIGVVWAIGALVAARELSLLLIVLGVGYLLFTGVAALPLSIAVILGAGIIAFAIYKAKA